MSISVYGVFRVENAPRWGGPGIGNYTERVLDLRGLYDDAEEAESERARLVQGSRYIGGHGEECFREYVIQIRTVHGSQLVDKRDTPPERRAVTEAELERDKKAVIDTAIAKLRQRSPRAADEFIGAISLAESVGAHLVVTLNGHGELSMTASQEDPITLGALGGRFMPVSPGSVRYELTDDYHLTAATRELETP